MRFADQAIVITGASTGIGRATALAFGREGASVMIGDIDDGANDTVAEIRKAGGKAEFRHCDVARGADCDALVAACLDSFGRLDSGFNNAGVFPRDLLPIHEMSDEEFDQVIAFMLTAFDDPRIVFNTRDWRQVSKSGWWAKQPPDEVRQIIEACDERFRRAHARYSDRTFMIDHADYNGNPDGFSPLLAWLGESLDEERVRGVSEKRLTHLVKPPKAGRLRRSLNRLTGWFRADA